jgi:NADPH2:quinone reductase
MKAIRVHKFGGPEVLQLDDVPDPKPGPGQVLVRIRAAGVNPVDTYIRTGTYTMTPALPYVPGADAAGVVDAVGDGVKRVRKGDRVYVVRTAGPPLTGGYAELAVCHEPLVQPLPSGVSFSQGAAVAVPYGTAYRGLHHKAHARPGETVLVHGASGGVGIAAVQLAKAHGMTVVGTAGSERGRTLVAEHGAHHVLDHTAPDYLQKLMALTEGRGADVILEMLANVNLQKDLDVVARFGRIIVIGNRGAIEINAGTGASERDTRGDGADPRRARRGAGERHAQAGRRPGASAEGRGAGPRGGAEAGSVREDRADPLTGIATSCRPVPSWRPRGRRRARLSRAASSPGAPASRARRRPSWRGSA